MNSNHSRQSTRRFAVDCTGRCLSVNSWGRVRGGPHYVWHPILMRGAAIMGVIGFPIAITGLRAITGRLIWVGAASGRISGRMLSVNILNAQGGLAPFELERLRDQ
jgi:hypothetical protein